MLESAKLSHFILLFTVTLKVGRNFKLNQAVGGRTSALTERDTEARIYP